MTNRRTAAARPMRQYAVLLDPFTGRRVARIIKRHGLNAELCSADGLLAACDTPSNTAIIFDPALLEPSQLYSVMVQLSAMPRAAIAYSSLSSSGVAGALDSARHSTALVVFQSLEEDITALTRTLIAIAEPQYTNAILDGLEPRLAMLPQSIASAVVASFIHEPAPAKPAVLARRAFVARRSLDRWFERVGISSARMLMLTPILLRALTLMQMTTLSFRRIAHLSGYRVLRRLTDHSLELTGMFPTELRAMREPMDAVETMLGRLLQPLPEPPIAPSTRRRRRLDDTSGKTSRKRPPDSSPHD